MTRPIALRPYDPGRDADACLAIWRAASRVGHPFLSEADLDADAGLVREVYLPAARITVAEERGRVVGFLALLEGLIGGLFVDPAAQGRGVGRALVRAAAAEIGALEVEVYAANAGARAFYARLGFVETGRRDRDDRDRPLPLVRMRRAAG
jgi:ribosomal protein S18 acetylase RimI-like enzyme